MKAYIHLPLRPGLRSYLDGKFPQVTFIYGDDLSPEEQQSIFNTCEVSFGQIPPEWLPESTQLKWVQIASAGINKYLDLDWDRLEKQITLTNLHGLFGESVAETALAGILAMYRRIDHLVRLQVDRSWDGRGQRKQVRTLKDKKVIIMGPGAIGNHLKEMLQPFGCEVIMFGRRRENADIISLEELDAGIPKTDILVATLPETPETIKLLNRERLALLPVHSLLVSVGRGSVLDENALTEMLQNQKISGAVIDVTVEEPLPQDHPFWDCPDILLTQHTSGGFEDEVQEFTRIFAGNLKLYLSGEPLKNVVNWAKGY